MWVGLAGLGLRRLSGLTIRVNRLHSRVNRLVLILLNPCAARVAISGLVTIRDNVGGRDSGNLLITRNRRVVICGPGVVKRWAGRLGRLDGKRPNLLLAARWQPMRRRILMLKTGLTFGSRAVGGHLGLTFVYLGVTGGHFGGD
jgi:hypothetical protein